MLVEVIEESAAYFDDRASFRHVVVECYCPPLPLRQHQVGFEDDVEIGVPINVVLRLGFRRFEPPTAIQRDRTKSLKILSMWQKARTCHRSPSCANACGVMVRHISSERRSFIER